jgi:aminopeptidase N
LRKTLGTALAEPLGRLHRALSVPAPFKPDAASAGRRALRQSVLGLMAAADETAGARLAKAQFDAADNMTDKLGALLVLSRIAGDTREATLEAFAATYRDEPLILDKWFMLQAAIPEPQTLERVKDLMRHPGFSLANPNRVRALIGSFAMANQTQFNRPDGAGFALLADIVLELDSKNPQVAARLLTAFRMWRALESERRGKAEATLRRVSQQPGLSPDVSDIVVRSLS